MRYVDRAVLLLFALLGACLAIGCSEESTGPVGNGPPARATHIWSYRFGDGSSQHATAVAVDSFGSVIVTGCFRGTVDFGGGALASAGDLDIFVAKFGSDGAHLWSKRFGDADWQEATSVVADAAGCVIVTGYFRSTVDFGGGALTSTGNNDIFVAKFGPDGAHLWSKRFGDAGYQEASAVAADVSGDVIVTGYFGGTVDFGGDVLASAGGTDIFVAKFGSDGAHLWSKRFGDDNGQYAEAIAVDASGNAIVTGWFLGSVDFGSGALASAGGRDIFVAKFGSDGALLWGKRFGDSDDQQAVAVAIDAYDDVVVIGSFDGTVDFGGGALTSAGGDDIFLAKLGSDGAHLWSKRFGDAGYQGATSVAVDVGGNVIFAGYFMTTVDFGGGELASAGSQDIFVAKFDSDGGHLWSKRFGEDNAQFAEAVAVDAAGNMIVTGDFGGIVDFGGGELTSIGSEDIFVAKFGP